VMFNIAVTEGQVLGHDHRHGRPRWGSLEANQQSCEFYQLYSALHVQTSMR